MMFGKKKRKALEAEIAALRRRIPKRTEPLMLGVEIKDAPIDAGVDSKLLVALDDFYYSVGRLGYTVTCTYIGDDHGSGRTYYDKLCGHGE